MAPVRPKPEGASSDSQLDFTWIDAAIGPARLGRARLPVNRARALLLLGLLGAALVVLWLRFLASEPHLPLAWRLASNGTIELDSSSQPALQGLIGQRLRAIELPDGRQLAAHAALLPRSPRWIVDDADRQGFQVQRALVGRAVSQPQVVLQFESGKAQAITPQARGLAGLGALCWAVSILALALYLVGVVVVLTAPGLPASLFAVLLASQCLNLLLIGAEALPGMGLPTGLVWLDLNLRLLADALAAITLLHVLMLYPQRLPHAHRWALVVWGLGLGGLVLAVAWAPAGLWWWTQGGMLACGLATAFVLRARPKQQRSPLARLLQRLVLAGTGTLLLLSLAMAIASHDGLAQVHVATIGSVVWYGFFASLLMLGPFLSRSRQILREFMLLAGVSTVASSLDLMFLAALSLHPAVSLVLALAVSLGIYVLARPWMLGQLAGSGALSAERMFDSLYRAARALEKTPEQVAQQVSLMLREIFDPIEVAFTKRGVGRVRVAPDGSTMVVPVPGLAGQPASSAAGAIVLRYARRGRHLFTQEDQQLCERLIEQLRRAMAYDRAVEHGRTEERHRIAQDLHDDIGARLLTLMYKAPNAEIEEYIRHTLQDLKTLTRGLAASSHPLSHAAAEWKADLTQRLSAAGCDLHWSFSADRELTLSVVQWSGLTRVLRELVNNIIAHAQATQVEISVHFDRGRIAIVVADDGIGQAPETWSHGLGLGGVRKRVKLLGGSVVWQQLDTGGIRCEVRAGLAAEK